MIESLFILMVAIAFIIFIISIEKESIIYSMIGLITWVYLMANSLWIEVPFSTTDGSYAEISFGAFCLIFIFAEIVFILGLYFGWVKEQDLALR